MDFTVYYRHWNKRDLRSVLAEGCADHIEAIYAVKQDVRDIGDSKSFPFLTVIQGGGKA